MPQTSAFEPTRKRASTAAPPKTRTLSAAAPPKKEAADRYKKIDQKEHVFRRPNMYIGDPVPYSASRRILTDNTVTKATFSSSDGLERLFWEILSNSSDNVLRTRDPKEDLFTDGRARRNLLALNRKPAIEITMNETTITVRNYGLPFPIAPKSESTEEELILPPDLVLGNLLAGTNFEENLSGAGQNGLGAKLTNLFSVSFDVKVGDPFHGQFYHGLWINNMSEHPINEAVPGFEWVPAVSKSGRVTQGKWISRVDFSSKKSTKNNYYNGPEFVKITYITDFSKFLAPKDKPEDRITKYTPNHIALFQRFALDVSFAIKVPISFNGVILDARKFKDYVRFYFPPTETHDPANTAVIHYQFASKKQEKEIDELNLPNSKDAIANALASGTIIIPPAYEIIVLDTPDANESENIGMVNGLGVNMGVHLEETIFSALPNILAASKKLAEAEKNEAIKITPSEIKSQVTFIVNAHIIDPKFRSQDKSFLTNPKTKIPFSPDEFKSAMTSSSDNARWKLAVKIDDMIDAKTHRVVSKTRQGKPNFEELSDSNWTLHGRGHEATLFIIEGKSASKYIIALINCLPDKRDRFGRFSIRGKFLNVTKASNAKLLKNAEYDKLVRAIGLTEREDYTSAKKYETLRYGKICIVTDADEDGSSIRSLLLNLFATRWPSLLQRGAISYLATPAVRVTQNNKIVHRFFSDAVFDAWALNPENARFLARKGVKAKHLKGLATTPSEIITKDDLWTAVTLQVVLDPQALESVDLAFANKRSNDRKVWISTWYETFGRELKDGNFISIDGVNLEELSEMGVAALQNARDKTQNDTTRIKAQRGVTPIINWDLAQFSFGSLRRAIPSYLDGMKHAQRQALYVALHQWNFGRSDKDSEKVSVLAGTIIKEVHYAHGNEALEGTITRMAQGFAGTNNLPLLFPDGQFGFREEGPGEFGAARYLQTRTNWMIPFIFDPEIIGLVERESVEGHLAENKWLPCIVPMAVINGAAGIATGWSTNVVPHNPLEVVRWLLARCRNEIAQGLVEEPIAPEPWFAESSAENEIITVTAATRKSTSVRSPAPGRGRGRGRGSKMQSAAEAAGAIFATSSLPDEQSKESGDEQSEEENDDEQSEEDERSDDEQSEEGELKESDITKAGRHLISRGKYTILREPTPKDPTYDLIIEELPIGVWNVNYDAKLNAWMESGKLRLFSNKSYPNFPRFELFGFSTHTFTIPKIAKGTKKAKAKAATAANTAAGKAAAAALKKTKAENGAAEKEAAKEAALLKARSVFPPPLIDHEKLEIVSKFSLNNFILLDENNTPHRFRDVKAILEVYFKEMDNIFLRWKIYRMEKLRQEIKEHGEKRELIMAILEKRLITFQRPKPEIHANIEKLKLNLEIYKKLRIEELEKEEILRLEELIRTKTAELQELTITHHLTYWIRKLTVFQEELEKRMANHTLSGETIAPPDSWDSRNSQNSQNGRGTAISSRGGRGASRAKSATGRGPARAKSAGGRGRGRG